MNTPTTPNAASASDERGDFAAAVSVLKDGIASKAFPGCAFGVLVGGEVQAVGAVGNFTYEGDSPKVTAETVFDLASVSKVVATTAMAMLLRQRGLLDLDSKLGEFLPGFLKGRALEDPAHNITLRHLFAHNSGLPGYVEFFRTTTDPSELLRACLQLPLEAEPGTRAEYSDPGFILLGKALEVSAGKTIDSFAAREIFAPLAMKSTGYCPAPQARETIPPTEEDNTFRHRRIQGEVQDENAWALGGVAGHAGLFSNVPDLLRFSAAILNSNSVKVGSGEGANLFLPQTVQLFAERQKPEGSSRAIGWDTPSETSSSGSHFSPHSIGHLGFSGCSLWIDLDARLAVVLLTNRTWPDRKSQLIRTIRPAFHNAIREALA